MAITTYAELQTAVGNWLHRADLSSQIPDFIVFGEKRIFRETRVRVMEAAFSDTMSSGVIAVPSDYLEFKSVYLDTSPTIKLGRVEASQIYDKYPTRATDGYPQFIAREGSNFIFGPYPSSDFTVKGIYYAQPTSIQSSANALFLANPDLYLYAALLAATPYLANDARIQVWENEYLKIQEQLRRQDKAEDASGGGLMVRAA